MGRVWLLVAPIARSPTAPSCRPASWWRQVEDMAEAIEWVKRCPHPMPGPSEIEIRSVFEVEDFGEAMTPELREQ